MTKLNRTHNHSLEEVVEFLWSSRRCTKVEIQRRSTIRSERAEQQR